MLHGNPTWSFYYRDLIHSLRGNHRCIAPDHIGCGLSDKPQTGYGYSLKERVDDVERLIDHLKPAEPMTLVVHDWGGMIGFALAARRPELFNRFVVLNTAAFHLPKTKRLPFRLWLGRNTKLGEWLIRRHNVFCRHAAAVGTKRAPLDPKVREGLLAPYDSWDNRIAVARFVRTIPLKPGDPGYDSIDQAEAALPRFADMPMLIGWGLKDFVFDGHFLDEWKRRFPKAEVHAFPDCGHYILEDAKPELLKLVPEFLARTGDGSR